MNTPSTPKGIAVPDTYSDFDRIPLIDLAGIQGNDPEAKQRVAIAMRRACTEVGFFYISNHGVPQELIAKMLAQGPLFFGQPQEEKMAIHVRKSPHQMGYIANGDENANPLVSKGDIHEAFDFAIEDMQVDGKLWEGDFRKAGNQWPRDLAGFHEVMTRYGLAMKRLARTLFHAFALALNLPEDYFDPLSDKPMALVRILFYPTVPGPLDESRMGNGAHTDHECFTILCQDQVPALQVRNRRGEWIDAPPIPGAFVVNIGDLMARWTNSTFASTYHRVANQSGRSRYSIPCFIGANAETVIEALPGCTSAGNPAKYPPVKAGEYISTLIYHNFYDNQKQHPLKAATLSMNQSS